MRFFRDTHLSLCIVCCFFLCLRWPYCIVFGISVLCDQLCAYPGDVEMWNIANVQFNIYDLSTWLTVDGMCIVYKSLGLTWIS